MPAPYVSSSKTNTTSGTVLPEKYPTHIPALDAIRGLAILVVTLYRFRPSVEDASATCQWLESFLVHGQRGVDLFFVLSGFLITGILYDAKRHSHYFRNFYARRTLRIFPLYYGVLIGALVILPLVWTTGYPFGATRDAQGWLWGYCTNLVIAWRGDWCFGYFDHFWSLAVEEHFYFLWPLVIYFSSRVVAQRWCLALAFVSAGTRIACAAFTDNGPAVEVLTLFHLDALLVGAWFALASRGPRGLAGIVPTCRWLMPVSGVLLLPELLLHKRLLTVPDSLYALCFGAMIVLAVSAGPSSAFRRVWQSRVLRWLGKYSYGMYVFQLPLIPLFAYVFTAESLAESIGSRLLGHLAYILLMLAATIGTAFASWHLYEKHFLKWKRYFTSHPAPPRSSQKEASESSKTSEVSLAV
ncbi:MAG: acyltransferase [Planctomycetaceae bacterium]|nr:acyltransferase [Planctomycetaceae bacterium]